jgi:hypothetical protein
MDRRDASLIDDAGLLDHSRRVDDDTDLNNRMIPQVPRPGR